MEVVSIQTLSPVPKGFTFVMVASFKLYFSCDKFSIKSAIFFICAKSLGSNITPSVPISKVSKASFASFSSVTAAIILTFSDCKSARIFSNGMTVQSFPTNIK